MKKICFVSATPLSIHFFLKPHIRELSKEFDVTLVCNFGADLYVPDIGLPIKKGDIRIERNISIGRDVIALLKLILFFKKNSFNLVVSVSPKAGLLGMLAAFIARVPNRLHIFQGEVWASKQGVKRFILKFADRVTAYFSNNIIAVSHSERLFLIDEGVCESKKIRVLNHGSIGGVDLERYKPDHHMRDKVRSQLKIPADAVVVIFVGRLNPDKGIYELANAFRYVFEEYPEVYLLCVGPDEGQVLGRVRSMLGAALTNARFIGFSNKAEEFMMAADFLCLPSYREGLPVVVLEAAALGLPAVASNIYGISDAVIDGYTGILVEPRNSVLLAAVLESLVINQPKRISLGLNAQKRVRMDFADANVVSSYVNYIRGILE